MTEADSSESAGSEKLEDDYEFLDYNNGGVFVQVHFFIGSPIFFNLITKFFCESYFEIRDL